MKHISYLYYSTRIIYVNYANQKKGSENAILFSINAKKRLHFLNKFGIIRKAMRNASVAQQVEQLIRNQQVAGPNPATSSKKAVRICYVPLF